VLLLLESQILYAFTPLRAQVFLSGISVKTGPPYIANMQAAGIST
jgi:hypothetical protein